MEEHSDLLYTLRNEVELIERHVMVLDAVLKNEPIGVVRLGRITGLKDHRVRYSLRMLEREGLIRPTHEGAVLTSEARKRITPLKRELKKLGEKLLRISDLLAEERAKMRRH